jgi:hypothetical protein
MPNRPQNALISSKGIHALSLYLYEWERILPPPQQQRSSVVSLTTVCSICPLVCSDLDAVRKERVDLQKECRAMQHQMSEMQMALQAAAKVHAMVQSLQVRLRGTFTIGRHLYGFV